MEANLHRRIQRYGWDRAVPYYEKGWKEQLYPAQSLLLKKANLQPGERVLETACGTGLVTMRASSVVGPEGVVVATDISDRMVDTARDRAQKKKLAQTTVLRQNAERLRIPAGYFDAALCSFGMMYYLDPEVSLIELRRGLRIGGRVAVSVWGQRDSCGWNAVFPIVDARVPTEVCPLFFQLGTGDNLKRAFLQTGFQQVEIKRMTTVLRYRNADEALKAIFAGGPVAMAYTRFDPSTLGEVHAAYLASIEPFRQGEAYAIPSEFILGVAQKNTR